MTRTKWLVFKRSHWIHLEWWSTGSLKLQLFQLSQHSHATKSQLISSSAYFPRNMTLNTKCSHRKVHEIKSYILSRGHSVFRRKKYFLSGGLSLEAIHQSSRSSFRDFFVKDYQGELTTLLGPPRRVWPKWHTEVQSIQLHNSPVADPTDCYCWLWASPHPTEYNEISGVTEHTHARSHSSAVKDTSSKDQ